MKVLVTGATGRVGGRLIDKLRDHEVVGVSTSTDPKFDWNDDKNWQDLLKDVEVIFLMAPDGQEFKDSFFSAAEDAGVRKIVLLSSQAIEEMNDQRLLAAEKMLKSHSMEWAIVRSDWIMQNFETFFRPMIMSGEFKYPAGDYLQGFIDADDVAEVAKELMLNDKQGTFEISGQAVHTFRTAISMLSIFLKRKINFVDGDVNDYAQSLVASGVPEKNAQSIAHDFVNGLHVRGNAKWNYMFLGLVGKSPKDLSEYFLDVFEDGTWD